MALYVISSSDMMVMVVNGREYPNIRRGLCSTSVRADTPPFTRPHTLYYGMKAIVLGSLEVQVRVNQHLQLLLWKSMKFTLPRYRLLDSPNQTQASTLNP